MATEIKIPIPDQTTEEVRVVKWKIDQGDTVNKGDIVLEVETDKSVIEVEAVGAGVLLEKLYAEDDMVPVGKVVGYVGEPGEKIEALPEETSAIPTTKPAPAPAASTAPVMDVTDERVKASPVAKKLAAKLGIELTQIEGTGPGGRILREDVEKYDSSQTTTPAQPPGRIFASPNAKRLARDLQVNLSGIKGTGPDGRIVGADVEKYAFSHPEPTEKTLTPAADQPQPGTTVELTRMRRAIGINLQTSSRDTPHFNVTISIDMNHAIELRSRLNQGKDKPQRVSVIVDLHNTSIFE